LFHAGSGVYSIAPNVVGEFFNTYYTRYEAAAVVANAHFECQWLKTVGSESSLRSLFLQARLH
jgi:hypothetical protein